MPSDPPPAVPPSSPRPPLRPVTPGRNPAEEIPDPNETMFFQRRAKRKLHLLPSLVLAILVLGSGILVTWAFTRSNIKPAPPAPAAPDPFAGRPVMSPEAARRLAEQPGTVVVTPAPAPTDAPPAAVPVASAAPSPEVRRALPVDPAPAPGDPAASFDEANVAPLNTDLASGENAQVKSEVLARVDLMPEVSQDNKDKLYAAVDRARGMGRIITIPFEKGRNAISDADAEKLRRRSQAPDIRKFTEDPTVVFIVLGYADQKGDPKLNYQLSLQRSRSVVDALRDRCGFQNVMHAVAMGGSTLFSQKEADKNRVVEVWAVLP